MKKIYISPKMDVVEIKHHQMLLAGSTIGLGDPGSAVDAEAPVFGIDNEFFGEDEVNFFE